MTDKTNLIREILEYVTTHGGENTATHLLVQAASAIQAQAAELEAVGAGGVQELSAAPEAIAKLRHLYQNMVNGAVRDTASAKRIAEGLLAPAIEALERATPPAEQQAQPGAVYAGLPDSVAWLAEYGGDVFTATQLLNFADRTHALRMQATPKVAPGDVLDESLRERDDAEDFIDALLDEVLGHERPEWSSSYGRADALNDVQERMTALHKPAVDKAWGRFQSAMAAPQQEAQEPCQTCIAMARTVMMDQVSFDRKPDAYGIRQITDDDGVEEWEDIRTSPDVAREEANDMMATGRGEIYEVVPLWTTPQPAPAPLSEREAFERDWEKRHAPAPINGRTRDDGRYGDSSIQDAWESWQARAALAAQGGKV